MRTSLLTLVLAAVASAAPVALDSRVTCYSGVYVIGVRGTDEAAGYGSVASVVSSVLADIPDSTGVALDYPASYLDPLYPISVTDGINTLISLVESYADSCSGDIVLVGFSQGANIITDALAGGVDKPTPLTASYIDHSKCPTEATTDSLEEKAVSQSISFRNYRLWRPYFHVWSVI
jgi:acetylxylan esterase